MVLSLDLLEKSELGGSLAVQLPYDLLTLGDIEYTADTIVAVFHVSGVLCSTIWIWFKYKDSENSIPTYLTS